MKNKPKIAIIRGKFLNKFEMQLYEPLVADYDITAFGSQISFHDKFNFPVVKFFSPVDLPEFPYKMSFLNRMFIDAHYLFGLTEKLKGFDLVHTAETYFHYTIQSLNAKKNGFVKKVVSTVLENIPHNNEGIWGRKNFKKRSRLEIDHFFAVTKLTAESLIKEGTNAAKISILPYYIDTKRFTPSPQRQSEIRNHNQKNFTILFVGRFEEYKGVFDIINAFKIILAHPKCADLKLKLIFSGSGSQKAKIIQATAEMQTKIRIDIINTPYHKMPEIYQQAHIFIAPSRPTKTWIEQYNIALLEAQASGLPILTTNCGGIPENIGDSGILMEPGDVITLAKQLIELLFDNKKRFRLAQSSRKRAENIHDISIGAQKLAQMYQKLLK